MIAMNVPLWFEKLIWKRCVCVGTEGIWARSVLSFQFCCRPKAALKKKKSKKQERKHNCLCSNSERVPPKNPMCCIYLEYLNQISIPC